MKTFQPLDLCFVDGTNMEMLLNQIMYFDRVSEKNAGGDCTYMVSGRSVLELNKRFFPRRFYPARDSYEKRFFTNRAYDSYHHFGTFGFVGYAKSYRSK